MGNPLRKFIPKWIAKFDANPSDKSLFFFEQNNSRYKTNKKITNWNAKEILCDDEIAAAIDTRIDSIVAMPWKLTGGVESNNKFIYDLLKPFAYQMISYSWWAVYFGHSAFQIVYARKGNDVIVSKVTDEDYTQFSLVKGEWLHNKKPFPEGKYFITVNKPTSFNPEGSPLAAKLAEIHCRRKDGWEFFMKYLEKFGIPFFAISTDDNVSEQDREKMKAFLESDRPRGVILPNGATIETIDGKTTSVSVFESFETIMRERIQRVILGQTLTSGTGDTGSLALGEVHERVSWNKTFSDSIMITKTMNAIVLALYQLNKMQGEVPIFEFQSPRGLQADRANRDKVLSEIGVSFSEEYFVDEYDLDAKQIEYTPVEPNSGGLPFKSNKFASQDSLKFKASVAEKLEDKYIDDSPNLGSIIQELVKSAKSKEDLEKKLSSFIKKGTTEYDEALTDAMLNSSILGSKNV